MADEEKANYEPPASQVDLEERQKSGFASAAVLSTSDEYARRQAEKGDEEDENARSFAVEGNDLDGYLGGISPEYQTYANPTEKPHKAEEGPEQVLEEFAYEEDEKREEDTGTNIPGVGPNDEPPAEEPPAEEPSVQTASAKTTTKKTSSSSSSS